MFIQVSKDEHATILAALRFYQEKGQGEPFNRSDAIHSIATCGDADDVISLDDAGIDSLCERINCESTKALQIIALAHESRSGTEIWSFETEEQRRDWMLGYAKSNFGFVPASDDPDEIDEALTEEFNDCDEAIKWDYVLVDVRNVPADPAPAPAQVWALAVDTKQGTFLEAFATEEAAWRGLIPYCTRDDFDADSFEFGSDEMKEAIRETLEEDEAWYVMQEVEVVGARPEPEIAIIMHNGMFEDVIASNDSPVHVRSIDYDVEGVDPNNTCFIEQADGSKKRAFLTFWEPHVNADDPLWKGMAE